LLIVLALLGIIGWGGWLAGVSRIAVG